MRCRQAQQLMSDLVAAGDNVAQHNRELVEHLRACPNCAREVAAERILSQAFTSARVVEPNEATPLPFMRTRVEADLRQHSDKEYTLMQSTIRKITNHPAMSISFASSVLAIIIMSLVPISCSRTTGYAVDATDNHASAAVGKLATAGDSNGVAVQIVHDINDPDFIMPDNATMLKAIKALEIEDANVLFGHNAESYYVRVSDLNSLADAQKVTAVINELTGGVMDCAVNPVIENVESSMLAQLQYKILNVVREKDGLPADEIEHEIRLLLEEIGLNDNNVVLINDGEHEGVFIGDGEQGADINMSDGEFQWVSDTANGASTFHFKDDSGEKTVIDIKTDE